MKKLNEMMKFDVESVMWIANLTIKQFKALSDYHEVVVINNETGKIKTVSKIFLKGKEVN